MLTLGINKKLGYSRADFFLSMWFSINAPTWKVPIEFSPFILRQRSGSSEAAFIGDPVERFVMHVLFLTRMLSRCPEGTLLAQLLQR